MYRLTPEQQSIVNTAHAIAVERIAPHAERVDADGAFPTESVQALAGAGLLGLTIAPEFGGMGQGLRVASAVLDEVGQCCASTAMVYLMHLCGVACYSAAPEKAADQLRGAARGEHLSTLAWSERGSRSHFWAPISQAVRQNGAGQHEGRVAITAEKSFATSAGHADGYVVSTRWSEATTPLESMLYLVLRDDAGVSVAGPWSALGLRGNASAPMHLENVVVGDDRALSGAGKGFDMMLSVGLPWFQLGSAAISVGIAEAATQATQRHLTGSRFEEANSKLADLPNLRARLAQMRIETDRTRAYVVGTIDAVEQADPAAMLSVLGVKAAGAETAMLVTDLGMRACGGAAFSKRLGLERNFRDARASGVMSPTTDLIYEFVGRALCGMELF